MMNLVQVPAIHHTSSHPNHPAPAREAGGEPKPIIQDLTLGSLCELYAFGYLRGLCAEQIV